jgi:hypothetical protein
MFKNLSNFIEELFDTGQLMVDIEKHTALNTSNGRHTSGGVDKQIELSDECDDTLCVCSYMWGH